MPTADQSHVQALLKPYEERFAQIWLDAWDRVRRNPDYPSFNRRARATNAHSFAMEAARATLTPATGIQSIEQYERYESGLFLVKETLLVRFKKGDERGLSSNIPTQLALAINTPDENLELFDLPDVSRVDVVYRLNPLETLIADVLVVARDDSRAIWTYSIYNAAGAGELPTNLPLTPVEPPAADSGMRVPGRDADEKSQRDGSS